MLTDNKGKITVNVQLLTKELTNTEANGQNEKSEYCFHHNQISRQSSFSVLAQQPNATSLVLQLGVV